MCNNTNTVHVDSATAWLPSQSLTATDCVSRHYVLRSSSLSQDLVLWRDIIYQAPHCETLRVTADPCRLPWHSVLFSFIMTLLAFSVSPEVFCSPSPKISFQSGSGCLATSPRLPSSNVMPHVLPAFPRLRTRQRMLQNSVPNAGYAVSCTLCYSKYLLSAPALSDALHASQNSRSNYATVSSFTQKYTFPTVLNSSSHHKSVNETLTLLFEIRDSAE